MPSQTESHRRWRGPSGAADFFPQDDTMRKRVEALNAERFRRYLDHAHSRWKQLLRYARLDGTVEHTGGGVLTLVFHRPERGYSILVGPFGPDPDPQAEEASMGVCTPVYTGASVEPEMWTDARVDFLDPDPNRTREDFIRWLRNGVEIIDTAPFGWTEMTVETRTCRPTSGREPGCRRRTDADSVPNKPPQSAGGTNARRRS